MDILAATPGRLLDHLEQGNCSLDKIDILVLDEVDRMLDMGFLPDVQAHRPEVRGRTARRSSSPRPFPRRSSSSRAGRCAIPHKVEIGRTHSAADTISHCLLPGRRVAEVRPAPAPARAHRVQERPHLLPHAHGRRPDRGPAGAQGAQRGRHALRPEPARARRGARGLQERARSRCWSRPTSPRAASTSRASRT